MKHRLKECAKIVRRVSGEISLDTPLKEAVKVLAEAGIPHLVCGGYAVQHYGYPRFTADVDVIVPRRYVREARDKLSIRGFRKNAGSKMTLTHRKSRIEIDILPGGAALDIDGDKLPYPRKVSDTPRLVTLKQLLRMKLRTKRPKDYADAHELLKVNVKPRDFLKFDEFAKAWDRVQEELKRESEMEWR